MPHVSLHLLLVQGTYHAEYLVRGAAPQGITPVDIQRGRWTEGHWQVCCIDARCIQGHSHSVCYVLLNNSLTLLPDDCIGTSLRPLTPTALHP